MASTQWVSFLLFGLCAAWMVDVAAGGECCNSFTDLLGTKPDAEWCDNYCCGATLAGIGALACCDNLLLQADSSDTSSVCADWFTSHIWAPILIAAFCLGILVCYCVCCVKMFSSNQRTGTTVMPMQPQVITVPQQQPVGNYGYGPPGSY